MPSTVATPAEAAAAMKQKIKEFLIGVRDTSRGLAKDSGLEVEGFAVNVPPFVTVGQIRFKIK
jgi:hypothetical protein